MGGPSSPWLLALPQLAIVATLLGWWQATWTFGEAQFQPPGLLGAYRVIAYVALMRDEYPPFRLGR